MVIKQPVKVKEEEDRFTSERKGPKREVGKVIKPIGKSILRSSKRIPPPANLEIDSYETGSQGRTN